VSLVIPSGKPPAERSRVRGGAVLGCAGLAASGYTRTAISSAAEDL
jgi:hypothetical protein